jgi:multimeric flavodoxin WrbA
MKILLISSSPRREKSQTLLLAKEFLRGCSEGKNVKSEIIHLCDLRIKFCHCCENCHKKILACHVDDDVLMVLNKMLEADGIILASPNYINQITASMKALLERSSHFIHCKRLLGKYIAGVATSGSGQDRSVLEYIKYYAHTCGAQYSGGVSSGMQSVSEKINEASNLGNKFTSDIREKRIYPDQTEAIEQGKRHFGVLIKAMKNEWEEEYQYWLKKGWI